MKTKINFACVLTVFMLAMSFTSKAQSYVFKNGLNCDVIVVYEMRTMVPNPCDVCSSGQLVLPPGSSIPVPICPGYVGMCIDINQIGGAVPPSNHLGTSQCHLVSYGQSGPTTCSSGLFNVTTPAPNLWVIQ